MQPFAYLHHHTNKPEPMNSLFSNQAFRIALLPIAAAGFGLLVVVALGWIFDFSDLTTSVAVEQIPQISETTSTPVVKADLLEMLRLDFLTNIFPSNWN